ncbi:MAG: cation ABC transporter substrate-binding protein [Acidobacteria bacterium]|nr:MAG: cation ABC transporter substrate-binding protein [Acidobacteriota bacterium]
MDGSHVGAGAPAVDLQVATGDKIQVAVSVPPQAFLVDRIGGDRVEVQVMIPPGTSPAVYEPSPRQLVALSRARLFVKVGHPHFLFEETHLDGVLDRLPNVVVVEMVGGGDGHPGTESLEDPHVWLSPPAMIETAVEIAKALAQIDPGQAADYRQRLERLLEEIDRTDAAVRELLAPLEERSFVVFHPAWGHFAREYRLEQRPIEQEGKEPSPARLVQLIEVARVSDVRVIFVQEGFSDQGARVIANEVGAEVRALDPLAHDWPENLIQVATDLRAALAGH